MSGKKHNEGLLARVNFPLYTVQMLTSRHILVAGGGGSAKTGVANGFEVFELNHNGHQFTAEECLRHVTGGSVVMNCSVSCSSENTYLVAGQESHCQLYTVNFKVQTPENSFLHDKENGGEGMDIRKRRIRNSDSFSKSKESATENHEQNPNIDSASKLLELSIVPLKSVQTDFSMDEPLQRVVRISHLGNLMATGGTDGFIRLWTFPDFDCLSNIPAHSKEIDDIDLSIDERFIVSVAKDGHAFVWEVSSGKKLQDLQWNYPNGTKYLYKRCRFGAVEDNMKLNRLFMLTNPVGRAGKNKAYVQQWDACKGHLTKFSDINESVSALAVRNDGRFVAVGTMFSGSIYIFIAFSLQNVLMVKHAHNMFVTGLEFLPVSLKPEQSNVISPVEAAVLSISVDNRVCIHSLPFRKTFPIWMFLFLTIVILFCSFVLCSYLGL